MSNEKKAILIVDDEDHIVDILNDLVESIVDTIYTASNGMEALELVKKHNDINVILSDITMPVMDGIELIKTVREIGVNTPFIFFTGYGSEEYMIDALKYGAFDFLSKPKLDNLVQVVKKAFKNNDEPTSDTDKDFISAYREMVNKQK
ncbi:MAG: response regulator [Bacteriovoracaceae bacterium]|nr:response regulator [Bacteriovoracaceae bacterium]